MATRRGYCHTKKINIAKLTRLITTQANHQFRAVDQVLKTQRLARTDLNDAQHL